MPDWQSLCTTAWVFVSQAYVFIASPQAHRFTPKFFFAREKNFCPLTHCARIAVTMQYCFGFCVSSLCIQSQPRGPQIKSQKIFHKSGECWSTNPLCQTVINAAVLHGVLCCRTMYSEPTHKPKDYFVEHFQTERRMVVH